MLYSGVCIYVIEREITSWHESVSDKIIGRLRTKVIAIH